MGGGNVDDMRTPVCIVVAAFAGLSMAACSSGALPPSGTPTPTHVVSLTPSPSPSVPEAERLYTVEGKPSVAVVGTVTMRLIPANPNATFTCRPVTDAEWNMVSKLVGTTERGRGGAKAVDAGEGWAVIGVVLSGGSTATPSPNPFAVYLVTNGSRINWTGDPGGWNGAFALAGIALADGPKALHAVSRCSGRA